ncbi:MAG: hypothetical protein QGG40_01875, partial [Myxococcota bacterium]|nr:hypothetical protein [Myxococcota bacterium]
MLVTRIHVEGFHDLDGFLETDLDRVVLVDGPHPSATALGDALALAFAALHTDHLRSLLKRWELLGPDEDGEIQGSPFPEQATWRDRHVAAGLVSNHARRSIQVDISCALDPPQYGALRSHAATEPSLVAALAGGGTVHWRTGALFSSSWDAVAISLQSFAVGKTGFSVRKADRPTWLTSFLQDLASRFHVHEPGANLEQQILEAATTRREHSPFL